MVFLNEKPDFVLKGDSVNVMFTFNNTIKLNTELFCNELCEKFGEEIKCPIKMCTKRLNKSSMTFIVACIINSDIEYAIKCYISDIVKSKDLKCQVLCNTGKLCEHGSAIEGRPLKGSARKNVQQKLLNKMPKQVCIFNFLLKNYQL